MARTTAPGPSRFMIFATVVLVVASLWLAQEVLIPLALAVLISFLLTPLVGYLERLRLGRIGAVLVVTLAVSAAFVGLGYVVSAQTLTLANNLDQYRDNIINKIQRIKPSGGVLGKMADFGAEVSEKLSQPATTQATSSPAEAVADGVAAGANTPRGAARPPDPSPGGASAGDATAAAPGATEENPMRVAVVQPKPSPLTRLSGYLGLALGPLGTAGLVIVFAIFIMLEREDLRDRMVRLVGFGQLNITTKAMDDATTRISRYLLAQAIVNGTYGITISIGLWVIGRTIGHEAFPSVILWGLLCAVLRFIPYVGPWIAAAFPLAVAFAVYPGFGVFFATLGLFTAIELLSNNLMEPWLYGSSTGMTTIAVLVSAVFWTWLWGPVGLVMATPLTVCMVVIGKHVPSMKFLDILLGDDPVFAPPERVYQRLLALDAEEASEIAEGFLREMPLEQLYDTVLLPALAMCEEDRHRNMLDEEHARFIRQSVRDLLDELGDANRVKAAKGLDLPPTAVSVAPVDPSVARPTADASQRAMLPKDCVVSVLIMPAHDEADEVVGLMLAQLLQFRGYCVSTVSVTALASEMVQRVADDNANIVCVSALPPAAVTHSRYLCKRLHMKFPKLPLVVGLWSYRGDLPKARDRIACGPDVAIQTSLAKALDDIDQRAHPIIVSQGQQSATTGA